MKYSLLDLTQNILSSINGDEVNSIGDTVESLQVANEVKTAYEELFSGDNTPTFQGLFQLNNSGDPTAPTKMTMPDNIRDLQWMKYNWHLTNAFDYREVRYMAPDLFFERSVAIAPQTNTSLVTGPNGVAYVVTNNLPPQFYTTVNNRDLWFDSWQGFSTQQTTSGGDGAWTGEILSDYNTNFQAGIDGPGTIAGQYTSTTLLSINTMCYGQMNETFLLEDTYIPLLDDDLFPLLLAEAKSTCFINIKQVSSSKEEQRVRRLRSYAQKERWSVNQRDYQDPKTNFGRRSLRTRLIPAVLSGR